MQYFIIITLVLGLISALAAITAQLKEKNSSKEEKAVQHRIHRPVFFSVSSNAVDEREKMVDYLLKRKHLTLDEMQFIYDFLMDTGRRSGAISRDMKAIIVSVPPVWLKVAVITVIWILL